MAGWGGLVFGSTKHADGVHGGLRSGGSALYVVTDDIDGVHAHAAANGADVVEEPRETRFGSGTTSRVFTVRDPEGNLWTFGSYGG